MKVLMISGSYPPLRCGVGEYTSSLIEGMKVLVDCDLITSREVPGQEHIFPIVKSWNIFALAKIIKQVKNGRYDVIHIQYPTVPYKRKPFINILPFLLRLRFPHTPVLVTIHEYHDASALGKLRVIITGLFANTIIATNPQSHTAMSRVFGGSRTKLIPIGSSIPFSKLSPKEYKQRRAEMGGNSEYIVTYFGYVYPGKGVPQLIEAYSDFRSKPSMIIATDYNEGDDFHKKVKASLPRSGGIVWTGHLNSNEVSSILQVSDVVVLPFDQPVSLRRSSLMAALTHGCAIITTGPAVPPLLDGVNIVALSNNEPHQLASAIDGLLRDDKMLNVLRRNALELSKSFEWSLIASEHKKIYSESVR